MQTFFSNHRLISYFIVQAQNGVQDITEDDSSRLSSRLPPSTHPNIPQLTAEQQAETELVAQEWEILQGQHEQAMQEVETEQATHDRTGWWSLTKWSTHFGGCNMQYLAHASRVPDQDEVLLKEATRVVDEMLQRSVAGLATLHRETRRWLRSPKVSDPDVRPLARLQETNSQDRYYNYWRRFICYCFRVWLSRQQRGEEEADISERAQSIRRRRRVIQDSEESENGKHFS